MHEPSLAQQILIGCDKILFSHTQRGYLFLFLDYFLIFRCFLLFYVVINFYKKYFIIIILLHFFFMKIIFIFSCSGMFRDVPECSDMFRNVPCSGFYRRPLLASLFRLQISFRSWAFFVWAKNKTIAGPFIFKPLKSSLNMKIAFYKIAWCLHWESEAENFKTRLKVTPTHVFDVNGLSVKHV